MYHINITCCVAGGFDNNCLYDPTDCDQGFSLSFWLNYINGRFLLLSGSYTTSQHGPGLHIVCNKHRKILCDVTSRMRSWRAKFPAKSDVWTHYVITWDRDKGITVYANGVTIATQKRSYKNVAISPGYHPVMTLGRPNHVKHLREYGEFGISSLVIWLHELTKDDVIKVYKASETITYSRKYNVGIFDNSTEKLNFLGIESVLAAFVSCLFDVVKCLFDVVQLQYTGCIINMRPFNNNSLMFRNKDGVHDNSG